MEAQAKQLKIRQIGIKCASSILTNLLVELDPFLNYALRKSIKKYLKEFLLKLQNWNDGDTVNDIFNSLKVFTQRDEVSASRVSTAERTHSNEFQAELAAMTAQLVHMRSILGVTENNVLDEIEDTKNVCRAEEKMLAKWEEAQLAQTEAAHATSMETIKSEISQFERNANLEDFTAGILADYQQIKIGKLDELIERWQRKRDSDFMDLQIQEHKLQMDYEGFNETKAKFELDFMERQRVIDGFRMAEDWTFSKASTNNNKS